MSGPIDYSIGGIPDPSQALMQGLGQGMQLNQMQQARQQQLLQQQQVQQLNAELYAASRDPRLIPGLMVRYPQLAEKFKFGLDAMSTEQQKGLLTNNTEVASALASGKPEFAIKTLQRRQELLQTQGDTKGAAAIGQMIEDVRADPDAMLTFTLGRINVLPGGDKVSKGILDLFEERRKAGLAPSVQRKADAEATTAAATAEFARPTAQATSEKAAAEAIKASAEASVAPQLAKLSVQRSQAEIRNVNSQINERSQRLGLDAYRLSVDVAEKMGTLPTTKLDPAAKKAVDDAVTNAAVQGQSAAQMELLAQRVDDAGIGYGAFSWVAEHAKSALGFQGDVSAIRNEYARVRNSVAMKSLPPGSATDKDVKFALEGIPSTNADGASISRFLRGMAKLQRLDAEVSSAKAEWVSSYGGSGAAKRPATIGGMQVQPGMKFEDLAAQISTRTLNPTPKPTVSGW